MSPGRPPFFYCKFNRLFFRASHFPQTFPKQQRARWVFLFRQAHEIFEDDLVREIVRIANLSLKLGYQLEAENRMLSKDEAYVQLGHSASLLKAILDYSTR